MTRRASIFVRKRVEHPIQVAIFFGAGDYVDHVINVVGWGNDASKVKYWILQNYWGDYWEEMRYIRVDFGSLHVEDEEIWDFYEVTRGEPCVQRRPTEFWTREQDGKTSLIHNKHNLGAQPFESNESVDRYPADFSWCDKDGVNYCTMRRNKHIPQDCGCCWVHGRVSALGDYMKITRKAQGIDKNLSIQHILNSRNVGSFHGGSTYRPYYWLRQQTQSGTRTSYKMNNPYMAYSEESKEDIYPRSDWHCTLVNTAKNMCHVWFLCRYLKPTLLQRSTRMVKF